MTSAFESLLRDAEMPSASTGFWRTLPAPDNSRVLDDVYVTPVSQFKDDRWELPRGWLPPSQRHRRYLVFDGDSLPHELNLVRKRLLYALCRGLVGGRRGKFQQASPITAFGHNITLKRMMLYIVEQGYTCLSETPHSIYMKMLSELGSGRQKTTRISYLNMIELLIIAGRKGIVSDWPKLVSIAGSLEGTYGNDVVDVATVDGTYLPIPDENLLRLVSCARYFVERLGPVIPSIYARCLALTAPQPMTQSRLRNRELRSTNWGCLDSSVRLAHWPPTSFREIGNLVRLLQASIYTLIAVNTGLRVSELLSLTPHCLHRVSEGRYYLQTKLFKTSEDLGGEDIRFPVTQDVADAVGLLEALDTAIAPYVEAKSGMFFALTGHESATANSMNSALNDLCAAACIPSVTTHQFRKTLARLCALTLVEAPKMLQTLWRHADLDMTLRYIMALPGEVVPICWTGIRVS